MDFLPILYRPEFDYKLPQCIDILNTIGTGFHHINHVRETCLSDVDQDQAQI